MTKGVIALQKNIKNRIGELKIDDGSEFLFPHIEFDSNRKAIVDGSKGVIEYNGSTVRLNCGDMILKFNGDEMTITATSIEQITVSGHIVSFEFCSF